MAAAAILDFQKFKILTVDSLLEADMRHLAKFHQNRWNGRRDMVINVFLKMAAVRHLGFVGRLLGPPTMTTWWSLSLCLICFKSMQ